MLWQKVYLVLRHIIYLESDCIRNAWLYLDELEQSNQMKTCIPNESKIKICSKLFSASLKIEIVSMLSEKPIFICYILRL